MRIFSSPSIGLVVVFAAACGGKVVVDQLAEGAGGTSGNATVASVSSSSGAGGSCLDGGAQNIPPDLKVCAADSDCTTESIGLCCSLAIVGIATSELDAFEAYEAPCAPDPNGIPCECPVGVGGTFTDDGVTTPPGETASTSVACTAGQCMSFTM